MNKIEIIKENRGGTMFRDISRCDVIYREGEFLLAWILGIREEARVRATIIWRPYDCSHAVEILLQ